MSELDQTIEELEAEVLAELEEANGADAPKKGSVPAEGKKKLKTVGHAEIQDGGEAVVEPDADSSPTDVAADNASTSVCIEEVNVFIDVVESDEEMNPKSVICLDDDTKSVPPNTCIEPLTVPAGTCVKYDDVSADIKLTSVCIDEVNASRAVSLCLLDV